MHQELIRELAMITDEERRILEGKQEIDPQLYTEKCRGRRDALDAGHCTQRVLHHIGDF